MGLRTLLLHDSCQYLQPRSLGLGNYEVYPERQGRPLNS